MSNIEPHPTEQRVCAGEVDRPGPEPDTELLEPREVPLGGPRAMLVRRALPGKNRRMVGAWCFADVYGPTDVAAGAGMQVPPHPHIGLQTVSWLLRGTVHHLDGLGSDQRVRPGRLSLMTAGSGIAHSERTPEDAPDLLHGAQLWVALPDDARDVAPHFEHHADLPVFSLPGAQVTVIAGRVHGHTSPARTYTPLMGAQVLLEPGRDVHLPVEPGFEHGLLPLDTPIHAHGHHAEAGSLIHLGTGRDTITVRSENTAHLLLIGGEPFPEDLVMWWNFVGRDHDEIVAARTRWEAERLAPTTSARFAPVTEDPGPALPAPELPNARLRPRPRHRS
ncbi:pirin family protein [Nocardiopsis sp. MG754419]|uniref:pirin family protein n=1 Tax=Nocardiopsis sp. MG754419 TaxID=2259865 RepID=UPI001BADC0FC|nr:pirin family protein [Nocardiopsis sp. MG754419]MBR8744799.1 pirin family protein [Nocardiopsis sp. MG754419]